MNTTTKKITLENLLLEVHKSLTNTKVEIHDLIDQMKDQFDLANPTESPIIVPLIKDCLSLDVKSNDSLIKLVDIVQKGELNKKEENLNDAMENIRRITNA